MTHQLFTKHFITAMAIFGTLCISLPAWGQPGGYIFEDYEFLPKYKGSAGPHLLGTSIDIDATTSAVTASGQAILFDLASGTQIAELFANDGATGDRFGSSIAIGNGVVVVGGAADSEYGYQSGSVYVFDAQTRTQRFKLNPSEGAEQDAFGGSVAIGSGVIAVGASGDDQYGESSGAVYLFDIASGGQISKIVPEDGVQFAYFGHAIAIDNGILAVGAYGDDDNGTGSGSAYLYDLSTNQLITKLLPNDGDDSDIFGVSVDINGGIVVVGAMQNNDQGISSGSAYTFDTKTGAQLSKLLPDDGIDYLRFGVSVSIDGETVAIKSEVYSYLFNAISGSQIVKLIASDVFAGDSTGFYTETISMKNGKVVVGAPMHLHKHYPFARGGVYVFPIPIID